MSLTVLTPGLLSSVQDGGRHGHAALGVGAAGAMDATLLRIANLLVGNVEDAAAIELTLQGPTLRADSDLLVAVAGDVDLHVNGGAVATWRPIAMRAGSELALGPLRHGARAYLAIAGGLDLPAVLGSRSSDVNAGLGPPPLRAGQRLACARLPAPRCPTLWRDLAASNHAAQASTWSLDPAPWFDARAQRPIRALAGAHFDALDDASQRALFGAEFRLGSRSDRVGCRLEGHALMLRVPLELVSAGVAPGTVQLPPGGEPIALACEAPTTGGYPRIAHVIEVDQGLLAQRRPGAAVRLARTDLDDARMRYRERERAMARLAGHLRERLAAS